MYRRTIPEWRVGRLNAGELQAVNYKGWPSFVYRFPGQGQIVEFTTEIDAVTDFEWIEVKSGKGFKLDQALIRVQNLPSDKSLVYYVKQ